MFSLAVNRDFIAQHFLIGGDWGRENDPHSHHYRVEARIEGSELNQHGYLIDIVDLEEAVAQVIDVFKDSTLNGHEAFRGINPSLERFAQVFWKMLDQKLALRGKRLTVKIWENDKDWAAYTRLD